MKYSVAHWGSIFISALVILPLQAAEPAQKNPDAWPSKMRGIEKVFQELMVDLVSDERFNSPKNFKRIEKNVEKFSQLAHSLGTKEVQSPDLDPSIQLIASLFSQEANYAYQTLISGHRPYARKVLRSMSNYCVACHTRSNSGPSFQFIAGPNTPFIDSLKSLEKAEYFSAVRQFDRSLEEYDRLIKDAHYAADNPFDWEKAIRSALAISIRVKNDPNRALAIVDQTLAMPKTPFFLKDQASHWKKSLLEWKAEKPANPKTEEEYFAEANRLITAAKVAQKYPADRSADMIYLRASAAIHEMLSFAPNGKHTVDGFYLAGLCYDVLDNMNLNEMNEFYYLACVLKAPHTDKARQCYRNYEESVYLGYTGSSGTHIPSKIKDRLDQLDLLSNPTDVKEVPKRLMQ